MTAQIFNSVDVAAVRIDELADLCELWKKRRKEGLQATYIRRAVIDLCRELILIHDGEEKQRLTSPEEEYEDRTSPPKDPRPKFPAYPKV